ncbi:MAG: DnaJ C-terminal domain-containing protein [Tepidisphaeraceae bacterium]
MAKRDYYEILGVKKDASADEIKRAHRKLARKLHPDVNKDKNASKEFAEVQEAYDVLSDVDKRKKYDQFGHAMAGGMPSGGEDMYEQYRRAQQGGAGYGGTVNPEDFQGEFGSQFGDVFDQLFGGRGPFGRGGGRRKTPEQRGGDVEYPVTLTFEQAARGTSLSLKINLGNSIENIDVKVPAGVKDGSRVRVRGKGERSQSPGDLFIVVSVTPHKYYKRDGLDVLLDLPISLYEAVLGTRATVPTLDGPVTLTIPPGTSSGAKLRIKGRGVKRAAEQGDQFCVIKIIVPKTLTESEQAQILEMQKHHPLHPREDLGW